MIRDVDIPGNTIIYYKILKKHARACNQVTDGAISADFALGASVEAEVKVELDTAPVAALDPQLLGMVSRKALPVACTQLLTKKKKFNFFIGSFGSDSLKRNK